MATVTVNITAARSADVDEHAAALSEWNQRYLQLARGRFSGRLRHLEFSDGLKLFRETTNIKISEFFVTPNNRTSFAIPLPGSDAVRCCNEEARPGDLIVFRPGEGYHLECRGAFDVIGIEVENDIELDFSRGGVGEPNVIDPHSVVADHFHARQSVEHRAVDQRMPVGVDGVDRFARTTQRHVPRQQRDLSGE